MKKNEFMEILETIIENSKIGLLATSDKSGRPHIRWMTPGILRGRNNVIAAVTSKTFSKLDDLKENPNAEWQFQTRVLDKVANIRGIINIIDNSSLRNEVLEKLGSRLNVFWKVNHDPSSLVVLETVITEGFLFYPMQGIRHSVDFGQE